MGPVCFTLFLRVLQCHYEIWYLATMQMAKLAPPKSAVVLSCISLLFCLIVITAYRKEDNCHAGSTLHLSVSLVLSLDSMVSMFLMLG